MDFFTLRALAADWDALLTGGSVADAWTQSPGELSLLVEHPAHGAATVRAICDPALPLLFQTAGGGRQKRNTMDALRGLAGRRITGVHAADRDRHVFLRLDGGSALQVLLFGSRPNVLWVEQGAVRDAFLRVADAVGAPAPAPRPAPDPTTGTAFLDRWSGDSPTLGQAVRRAAPLLPPLLAADACRRAGLDPLGPPSEDAARAVAPHVQAVRAEIERGAPVLYQRGRVTEAVLPALLVAPPPDWQPEPAPSMDEAVRLFARRALGQRRFQALYRPVETALAAAHARRTRSAEAMLAELAQPSRADGYERWAHLLMAQAAGQPAGRDEVMLPDILGDGTPVTVPLDAALAAVQNAERYYDRARRSRRARAEAEARWETVQSAADTTEHLLARLRGVEDVAALQAFLADEAEALGRVIRPEAQGGTSEPFRRIALPGGAEALVGKNAKGNAVLTTQVAQPHDYWLHARGVPGSHVVVRRPSRTWEASPAVLDAAARVAAYYSTARSQPLAPVTVTERKYVRAVKGGAPGLVRVDREEVRIVEPGLPGRGDA